MRSQSKQQPAAPTLSAPDLTDSERTLAGALIIDPVRVLRLIRESGVGVEDFGDDRSRRVMGAVCRLVDSARPVEPAAVKAESGLKAAMIQCLIDDCPTTATVEYHAGVMRNASLKRRAIERLSAAEGAVALRMASADIEAMLSSSSAGMRWPLIGPDSQHGRVRDIWEGVLGRVPGGEGERATIVSGSKARKSWFVLGLSLHVAAGLPYCGLATVASRVAHIDLEIIPGELQARVEYLMRAYGISWSDLGGRLSLHAARSCGADMQGIAAHIGSSADLAVLDPMYMLFAGDESDQREIKTLITGLRMLCRRCAVVSVAHSAKGDITTRSVTDRISGSSVIARDGDTLLSLADHEINGHAVLSGVARHHAPGALPRSLSLDGVVFRHAPDVEPIEHQPVKPGASKQAASPKPDDIAPLAEQASVWITEACRSERLTTDEAVKHVARMAVCRPSRARDAISRLLGDGVLKVEADGKVTVMR